jgi:putative transposase
MGGIIICSFGLVFALKCFRPRRLTRILEAFAKTKRVVVLENLNVKGMTPKRSIADIGLYEFRRQLQYKSKMFGCEVIIADRFFIFQ